MHVIACRQVPSLDLVQMHWWDYSIAGMEDTALALADLQAKGLIKQIGELFDTAASGSQIQVQYVV